MIRIPLNYATFGKAPNAAPYRETRIFLLLPLVGFHRFYEAIQSESL